MPLELFDMEGCPHCRPVREALTELDLDVLVYPCPKRGERHRPRARALAQKERFPTLHDPESDLTLVGKRAILRHVFERFAHTAPPFRYRIGMASSGIATGSRRLRGLFATPARPAEKLLELWSFESSPYSRIVRERLCELELAYVLHNLGKEQTSDIGAPGLRLSFGPYAPVPGGKRAALLARGGRVQVPYLEDPNTQTKLYESRAIVDYLERTYAL